MLYPNSGSHSCFCLILDKVICPEDCCGPLCAVVFLETVSGLCLAAGSLSPAEGSAFRGSIVSFSGGGFFFFFHLQSRSSPGLLPYFLEVWEQSTLCLRKHFSLPVIGCDTHL